MFTGIIKAIGRILALTPQDGDMGLQLDAHGLGLKDVQLGDSIAVNGVCLTVTQVEQTTVTMLASPETLSRTTLGQLNVGDAVNLEKALLASDRLGGHFVSGHVDAVGEVVSRKTVSQAVEMWIRIPSDYMRYVVEKGSICIDGVSLTVNAVDNDQVGLMLIPHTLEETILQYYQPGTKVNIEVDLIARYLEKLQKSA